MPEEIDRAQIAPERVDDEDDVGPEQDRMGEPRQLHHQQEHQQPDDEILLRVGALRVDRDALELEIEIDEGIGADADVEGDQEMVRDRRQPFIEIARLIHEQDLQGQRDRQHVRDQLLPAALAGVEEPDQPDELDQREDEDQIAQRGVFLDRFARHGVPRPTAASPPLPAIDQARHPRKNTGAGTGASAAQCSRPVKPLSRSARAARDLPFVVPGLLLLEELGEARMHRHGRIGVDALLLQPDEVLGHGREAGVDLHQFVLLVIERFDHLVDHVLRHSARA